jgi:DNA-binding transcriptional LysR family regulator
MLARMELRHLRYFVAVAEEQNVTRAATRLHVSQPPLSRQIRDLEDELGIALFEHGAKSVRLTEAGRVFLGEARAVLQRADEAVEILPRALRFFQESNPGIKVQLHDLSTQEMLRGLRDSKLDVALLVQVSAKVMEGLVFEELSRYAVCVAVHPSHPLARTRKVSLEDVAKERIIAFTLADYPEFHAWLADLFAPFPHPPQIVEEHDSATSLIAAVEAGRGVALVSRAFDCLAGPRLKIRPLQPPPPAIVVGVAHRKGPTAKSVGSFMEATRRSRPG